jgi:hypothetical protein
MREKDRRGGRGEGRRVANGRGKTRKRIEKYMGVTGKGRRRRMEWRGEGDGEGE